MARSRDHATISAPRNRPGGGRSARCAVAERMGKQVRVSISDFSPDFSVTEIKTMSLTSPHLPAEAGAGYSSGCCALLPYRNLLPTPKFQDRGSQSRGEARGARASCSGGSQLSGTRTPYQGRLNVPPLQLRGPQSGNGEGAWGTGVSGCGGVQRRNPTSLQGHHCGVRDTPPPPSGAPGAPSFSLSRTSVPFKCGPRRRQFACVDLIHEHSPAKIMHNCQTPACRTRKCQAFGQAQK
ncbi:uncharacterized protein LOC134475842 isoform X2 [Cavia porcellus]|uniref:uncharacterized protein LOC134475842 isoform X2 n=1 Tax=Cavia porcellus TaxID=10141 RepID=UPI002FE0C293